MGKKAGAIWSGDHTIRTVVCGVDNEPVVVARSAADL